MTASIVGTTFFGLDLSKIKGNFTRFRRRISKRVLLIECGISSINLAEVKVNDGSISLDHIRRYPLPEEAMERGIPTDPAQMAALIKGHCLEEDIPAHRAAVVIPPDAAFTTLVQIPDEIHPSEALAYALNPASSVQVPIQLEQTDAELIPLQLPNAAPGLRSYFLTAVPRKLIDRLLETIRLSDLELLRLQIGTMAQLTQLREVINTLSMGQVILHLELLRECSLVTLVTDGGPIKHVRLTAIREFPEPETGAADLQPGQPVSMEREIVASDRYLPLSELDVRRLAQELRQTIQDAELQFPWICWHGVIIAGPNSAHPLLANLLQEAIGMPVELCRSMAAQGVAAVELKQPILLQRLGRLVGLGLGFLEQPLLAKNAEPMKQELEDLAPILSLPERLPASEIASSESDVQIIPNSESDAAVVHELPIQPEPESIRTPEPQLDTLLSHVEAMQAPSMASNLLADSAFDLQQPLESFASTLEPSDSSALSLDDQAISQTPLNAEPPRAEPSAPDVATSGLFSFGNNEVDGLTEASRSDLFNELNAGRIEQVSLTPMPISEGSMDTDDDPDQSLTPFSMGDLLSSYQAMQEQSAIETSHQCLPELDESEGSAEDPVEQPHLLDDPSQWPSVRKASIEATSKDDEG